MSSLQQAVFPARFAALRDTAAFVQRFCEGNGIGREDGLRLTLLVEELFTNTVQHGHGSESNAPIRVALELCDEGVRMLYEDTAPRYDPTQTWSEGEAALDAPPEARPVGGLGLALLRGLAAEARYAYEQSMNRLWLTLPCRQTVRDHPPQPGSPRE
ncbi:MAG TPA: ATP-binding protein [Casimicrobiaceae bacterium]|nr:ATP-binding protein [Casimicrobiaceae bacterium]